MPPHRTAALAGALALSALALSAAPAAAQQGPAPTADELHRITCVLLQLPPVRDALAADPAGPLLIVSGHELGRVRPPAQPCPDVPELPPGATDLRYIRPHAAVPLYGPEKGKAGVMLLELAPPGASPTPGASAPRRPPPKGA